MHRIAAWVGAFAFLTQAAAPAFADVSPADWDKVVAAAKKEGTLTYYTSDTATKCGPATGKWFTDTYGIKVETLAARGVEIDERIRIEQSAGRFVADVYLNGGAAAYNKAVSGALQPYPDFPNLKLVKPEYLNDDHLWLVAHDNLISYVVNTSELKPEEQPKSWLDLTDPRFKGKILSDDLRMQGNGLSTFEALYKAHGPEYWQKMAGQEIAFDRDFGKAVRRVATGEYLVYIAELSSYFVSGNGLPIKYGLPDEGLPQSFNGIAMVKNAPHPNAALLYLNTVFSPEWQLACANEGTRLTINGIDPAKVGEFPKALGTQKSLGHLDYQADKIADWVAKAKEVFK